MELWERTQKGHKSRGLQRVLNRNRLFRAEIAITGSQCSMHRVSPINSDGRSLMGIGRETFLCDLLSFSQRGGEMQLPAPCQPFTSHLALVRFLQSCLQCLGVFYLN